jgi:hypothetical protein
VTHGAARIVARLSRCYKIAARWMAKPKPTCATRQFQGAPWPQ